MHQLLYVGHCQVNFILQQGNEPEQIVTFYLHQPLTPWLEEYPSNDDDKPIIFQSFYDACNTIFINGTTLMTSFNPQHSAIELNIHYTYINKNITTECDTET